MNTIFLITIHLSYLIYSNVDSEILVSLEMTKINRELSNEIYLKDEINIIDFSVDDTESKGVEIQFEISTTYDSAIPFASSIKYFELTKRFSDSFQYLFHLEMFYLEKLEENNNIFSFSCSYGEDLVIPCGFYLNETLINFEGNYFERFDIDFHNKWGHFLQNDSKSIVHFMNCNSRSYLIIFLDIYNEPEKPIILNFDNFEFIKCIYFDNMNFFCLFAHQNIDSTYSLNLKYFNFSKFNNTNGNNTNNEDFDAKSIYEIDNNFSFNLSLFNNYAYDLYKTDDNKLIICFLINEDNLQKIICYKNTFEELISNSLKEFDIYKSCTLKKDGKPEFFDYEIISIIYVDNEVFKIIIYTHVYSKYLIIDLISLSSYITKADANFLTAKVSNHKKELYILNKVELTMRNNIQYLNFILTNNDTFIISNFEYPIKPNIIKDRFFLEETIGEVNITNFEPSFTLLNYTNDKYHYILLTRLGVITGTYQYKDIPSPLLFNYKFIIYPHNCLVFTSDALHCLKCAEGTNFLPQSTMCYSDDEIEEYYYLDPFEDDVLKCDENCYKCQMLKTEGLSGCMACNENFFIYKFRCIPQCPNNTFFYTYKRKIKSFYNIEKLMDINACTDICEEDYSGFIYKDNKGMINRRCILDKYKIIYESIEERIKQFLSLNIDKKFEIMLNAEISLRNFVNIYSSNAFNELCREFIVFNYYIYNLDSLSKVKAINTINYIALIFFNLVDHFFSKEKLLDNNLDNLIYYISGLNSLIDNDELLEKIYFETLQNSLFDLNLNLTNIPINVTEVDKINTIVHSYVKFINKTTDLVTNYIDPQYDQKEFESNK